MKHDHSMLQESEPGARTESLFVRCLNQILTYVAKILRPARSSQKAIPRKEDGMPDHPEIPTDEQVLAALQTSPEGLTPTELMQALQADDHSTENIIRAIQRVLDRGKVHLSDDAKLIVAELDEPAFA